MGNDIVLGPKQSLADESTGKGLLAHELAHVVQHQLGGTAVNDALHRRKNDTEPDEPSLESQVVRLKEDIVKLAQKNHWSGVNRTYEQLENLGDEAFKLLSLAEAGNIHKLGAQAAQVLGDIQQAQTRFFRANIALGSDTGRINDTTLREVLDELSKVDELYGAVRIAPRSEPKSKRKQEKFQGPELMQVQGPSGLQPHLRKSIEFAAEEIRDNGYFTGLIPFGEYRLGDESFTVTAGTKITDVNVLTILWGN